MIIKDIIDTIERIAPLPIQEEWDNSGLQIGNPDDTCTGVILCVDPTENVIREAIDNNCNLVISHHPLLFKPLKRICGADPTQRTAMTAIRHGINIYSAHTTIDNATQGVSIRMAQMLGLTDIKILRPQHTQTVKISIFVPHGHEEKVRQAMFNAGAGHIGQYDQCSYATDGQGTFRPLQGANPYIGTPGQLHTTPETKIEVVAPKWLARQIEKAAIKAHPYEEPAYDITPVHNLSSLNGLGAVGSLSSPLSPPTLAKHIRKTFGSPVIRCTQYPADALISRVALCGGSASELIPTAIAAGAQAFINSDTRYHDFVDHANSIFIADIGHYESEKCVTSIFSDIIREKFPNFVVRQSTAGQNPIIYM